MTPTEKIDAALDSVLKAQGMGILCYRQWPDRIDKMRAAMRKIMADSYNEGIDSTLGVRELKDNNVT